jgi:hypothetical protein
LVEVVELIHAGGEGGHDMPALAILLLTTDVVAQRLVENRLEVPPLLLGDLA